MLGSSVVVVLVTAVGAAEGCRVVLGSAVVVDVATVGANVGRVVTGSIVGELVGNDVEKNVGFVGKVGAMK